MLEPTYITWCNEEAHSTIGPSGEPITIGPGPVHALAWVNEVNEHRDMRQADGTMLLFSIMLLDQDGAPWRHVAAPHRPPVVQGRTHQCAGARL